MIGQYPELNNKIVVITGATSGIGLAAATQFAQEGAFVIGVGRSLERNQQALQSILRQNPVGEVTYLLADLAHQQQVRTLGHEIRTLLDRFNLNCVDVLINNAGLYLDKKQMTPENLEMTFAVNHLAGFLLTHLLLPLLHQSTKGRVITVTSYSHRTTPINLKRIANPWPYFGLLAYKRSKLCNVLFAQELNRRCDHITAFAVDPGLVNTDIASKNEPGLSSWVWKFRRHNGTHTDVPVKTLLFLAGAASIDTTQGCYFKDCKPLQPSKQALNLNLARALWKLSSRLTGINWEGCGPQEN